MLTLGPRRKPSSTPGSRKSTERSAQLNQLWTTTYWSQTYDNFDEIPVRASEENPALELDWKHFVSDTWKSYSQNQVDAIRPHADPRQFITTNTMGWFDGFDHYAVYSNLDIASWDDYIAQPVYNPAAQWRHPRSGSRIQTQELLGDGDRTGLRELERYE